MFRSMQPPMAWLTASALLLVPASGVGETVQTGQASASASLRIRVVIPSVMQVLENSHPDQMDTPAGGDWSAEQRLVVVSNMKRGFCVTLRLSTPEVDAWRLQTEQAGGITLSPVNDGYRLCAPRAGRYTLLLLHEFEAAGNNTSASLRWPVQTDITAL